MIGTSATAAHDLLLGTAIATGVDHCRTWRARSRVAHALTRVLAKARRHATTLLAARVRKNSPAYCRAEHRAAEAGVAEHCRRQFNPARWAAPRWSFAISAACSKLLCLPFDRTVQVKNPHATAASPRFVMRSNLLNADSAVVDSVGQRCR
jgi:hypothetical protein